MLTFCVNTPEWTWRESNPRLEKLSSVLLQWGSLAILASRLASLFPLSTRASLLTLPSFRDGLRLGPFVTSYGLGCGASESELGASEESANELNGPGNDAVGISKLMDRFIVANHHPRPRRIIPQNPLSKPYTPMTFSYTCSSSGISISLFLCFFFPFLKPAL